MSIEPLPMSGDGVEVLHARGELDVTVVPTVLSRVPEMLEGASGVVLDLTDVTFCDSSGIRLVDRLARECSRAGAVFRVVAPPGSAGRRILDLVGLAEGLAADDLPAAVAAAGPRRGGG